MGINQFADWTMDEYSAMLTNLTYPDKSEDLSSFVDDTEDDLADLIVKDTNDEQNITSLSAPASVDWR